jgi:hypothetical protein
LVLVLPLVLMVPTLCLASSRLLVVELVVRLGSQTVLSVVQVVAVTKVMQVLLVQPIKVLVAVLVSVRVTLAAAAAVQVVLV